MPKRSPHLIEVITLCALILAVTLSLAPAFIGESLATEPGASTQPATQPSTEASTPFTRARYRTRDMSHLRGIYQGILGYAGENSDKWPAYSRHLKNDKLITHAQGFRPELRQLEAKRMHSNAEALAGNISAAFWLLAREDHLPIKIFVNPGTKDTPDPATDAEGQKVTVRDLYDFASPKHFSYSFINFYHSYVRSKWSNSVGPTYVLAANDNNSDFKLKGSTDYNDLTINNTMNSKDHGGRGQNMLYGDGHAAFVKQPAGAFNYMDNVYTWWDRAIDKTDSASIKSLAKKNWSQITSTEKKYTVQPANTNRDVFLLPVDSLVKKKKK